MQSRELVLQQNNTVSTTREILYAIWGVALAVLFPVVFHFFQLGSTFLPMFVPVLTAALAVSPFTAYIIGAVSPFVSFAATGMPTIVPPVAAVMAVELSLIAALTSVLSHHTRWSPWLIIPFVMLFDRIGMALFVTIATPGFMTLAAISAGFPGVILQIALVPILGKWLLRHEK